MKEINIDLNFASKEEIPQIAMLSKKFEKENCCNGIVADDEQYFSDKKVAVAKLNHNIVGYCYGDIETKTRDTSLYKQGQKSFYIEEIYIDKKYRSAGIGQQLFNFIEKFAKDSGCEYIETTAVSKDYKKLLSFYIDKLDMNFWSASLIKSIKQGD